jgi:hypothetical protein
VQRGIFWFVALPRTLKPLGVRPCNEAELFLTHHPPLVPRNN